MESGLLPDNAHGRLWVMIQVVGSFYPGGDVDSDPIFWLQSNSAPDIEGTWRVSRQMIEDPFLSLPVSPFLFAMVSLKI